MPLANSGGQDFGTIDMTTALTNSVNTYWAQVGEQLGTETMVEYMERFGFYADPKLDYPDNQMRASGPYNADGRPGRPRASTSAASRSARAARRGSCWRPRCRWRRSRARSRTTAS